MSERNELDEAEMRCHEMLRYLREEYERAAKPYIEQLMRIHNIRPRTYVVDGKTFLPIEIAPTPAASSTAAD